MRATRDEEATVAIESLLLESLKFSEESRDVDDNSGSNEIDSLRIHKTCTVSRRQWGIFLVYCIIALTAREEMKVISDSVDDNCVPRIVTAGASSTHIGGFSEDIDKFPLAFISELCTEHNGNVGGGHGDCFCF